MPAETDLEERLAELLREGFHEGKIPHAHRDVWISNIRAKGGGELTAEGLAWGLEQLRLTEPLVTTANTAHRQPPPWHGFDADTLGPANWRVWAYVDKCALWEAVLLTVDAEPSTFVPQEVANGAVVLVPFQLKHLPFDKAFQQMPEELVTEIHGRLRVAISNLGRSLRPLSAFFGSPVTAEVSLPVFGAWAKGKWPELSPQFPIEVVGEKVTTPKESEADTRQIKTLLAIVGGIAKLAELPLDQPTTAAKAIVQALYDVGVHVGQRTVEEWLKKVPGALDDKSR